MCVQVCAHKCRCQLVVRSPSAGVVGGWELPQCGHSELKPVLLEERVLWTTRLFRVELLLWFLFVCLHLASFALLTQIGLNWKRERKKERKLVREEAGWYTLGHSWKDRLVLTCMHTTAVRTEGIGQLHEHPLLSTGQWFLRLEFLCVSTKNFLNPHRTAFRESGAMHSPVRKDPYF